MSLVLITPKRFEDARGWFSEIWHRERYAAVGIKDDFCQDNHSYSAKAFTLRGLHFQRLPHGQAKLIRCVRGRIFDVAVDIRPDSSTFKQWIGVELSATNGSQLYIPEGFAHGFLTLEDECEISYKVNSYYAPDFDSGIAWNDPELAIEWPMDAVLEPHISPKDKDLPLLVNNAVEFPFNGTPLQLTKI